MTPRIRKILWGLFILLVGLGLVWAYQRFVVGPHAPAYKWVREGKNYELLEPRTIGLVLITPLLLFIDLFLPEHVALWLFNVLIMAARPCPPSQQQKAAANEEVGQDCCRYNAGDNPCG